MFDFIFFTALYSLHKAITEELHSDSLLEKYYDDALDLYIILHLPESGDNKGVKKSLNLTLDTYAYEINDSYTHR